MASAKKAPKKGAKQPSASRGKAAAPKAKAKKPAPGKATKKAAAPTRKPAAPKKAAAAPKPKAAPKAPPAPPVPPAVTPATPAPGGPAFQPVEDPDFVRKASPAERKAALQAILEAEGVQEALPPATPTGPAPEPLPAFVRELPAQDRKAAVEQLVEESGVAGVLAKAPWKRSAPPAPTPPPAATEPPMRTSPKLMMTKAPIEPTTGRSPPRVVILDSNALMMQFQFHVDIEKEVRRLLNFNFDIVVPRIVLDELDRITKGPNQKEAGEARMAFQLAQTFRIEESPGDGDTGILRLAEKLNAIVVTNDKVLRARLRAKDIPNIYMRSRAFLTIEGHIPGM